MRQESQGVDLVRGNAVQQCAVSVCHLRCPVTAGEEEDERDGDS